ncbi:hypothetical protein LIER_20848 [Lithospermum erythrorhizon]|uniref:F-box domain-containing protein n=1 Tax=Lithospermum erythrorhizon TaxID=34254 RepID=A0AAV3QQF6_LITER
MDFYIKENCKKQKINHSDDHQQQEIVFQRLPRELFMDIVSRLPTDSLIQFRFVCKTFQNITYDRDLIQIHLAKSHQPCLILHCDYPLNNQLYFVEFPDHDSKQSLKRIQTPFSTDMPEFSVVGSCDGILCLVNSLFNDPICVYNPFTRQYRELPKSVEFPNQEVMYGFGCHPVSKDYKIIKIIYLITPQTVVRSLRRHRRRRFMQSEVQVFSLGGQEWKSIAAIPYQLDHLSGVASLNGRIHWVDHHAVFRGLIVSFDFSDEEFREIRMPERNEQFTRSDYHLAVLRGCLSVAIPISARLGGGLDIWIMKEYGVKESWVKHYKVGTYIPKLISQEISQAHGIWRNVLDTRSVRVLCLQDNGDILLEYKGGTLASYNPEEGTFKDVAFPGMPRLFQTTVHVSSLNWIE